MRKDFAINCKPNINDSQAYSASLYTCTALFATSIYLVTLDAFYL